MRINDSIYVRAGNIDARINVVFHVRTKNIQFSNPTSLAALNGPLCVIKGIYLIIGVTS